MLLIQVDIYKDCWRDMSEVDDCLKVLKGWKEEDPHRVMQVLQRVAQTKQFKGQELDDMAHCITEFHKEIGKAEEATVEDKWFEQTISIKRKLKKMQELQEKEKKSKPQLQKKPSQNIQYPPELFEGRSGVNDQRILKSLYRAFVTHFEGEKILIIPFLHKVLSQLKFSFQEKSDDQLNKRISSICLRLGRESTAEAKAKMLAGLISPKDLAEDDEQVYFDEKARETIRKNRLAQLQQSRTGFYQEMKKEINKNACEECKFCHKHKAFCEDMKQIRASDQPMTRFMRCNQCGKAWRD